MTVIDYNIFGLVFNESSRVEVLALHLKICVFNYASFLSQSSQETRLGFLFQTAQAAVSWCVCLRQDLKCLNFFSKHHGFYQSRSALIFSRVSSNRTHTNVLWLCGQHQATLCLR